RRIADGGSIRIFNDRGEMDARAQVTDRVPVGVVWMRDGWTGINTLTNGGRAVPDAAAKAFPGGQAAYEARVEVTSVGCSARQLEGSTAGRLLARRRGDRHGRRRRDVGARSVGAELRRGLLSEWRLRIQAYL